MLADPEKVFSGRDRASQCLSMSLASCHELMEDLQLPNTQVGLGRATVGRRLGRGAA